MFRTTLRERQWRPTATKVVLASGVAVACAVATMVGVAAASSAPRAAQPAAPPPPVDHHLCYAARVAKGHFRIPPSVVLFNQFSPRGFRPKIGPAALHCNPVAKTIGTTGQTFPITNPAAHLLCFRITAATQPTPTVMVTNQFGTAALAPGQPNLLCLPSWKSLKGPPHQRLPQPAGISHFTCYPVTELPGLGVYKPPPGLLLRDQFAAKPVPVRVSAIPSELCLPTAKKVGKKVFKIVNPVPHLLCFPVTQTPRKPRVFDKNQFGTAQLAIGATKVLCLPSRKTIIPDHHLCYLAEGQYKIPPGIRLINQFSPRGFQPTIGGAAIHCNPVVKTVLPAGPTVPIGNPAAHLLCFRMAAPKQPTPTVLVSNQFGSGTLIPGQPNLLCLPSWKGFKPPNMKVPQPPGLSHFTCYPVTEVPGTAGYKPPPVALQDQFAAKPVDAQVNPVPQELCLPTEKIVGKKVFKIINPVVHLLCFQVTPTPVKTPVFDQNQFGTSRIAIIRTQWLCVPSTKKIVKPTP